MNNQKACVRIVISDDHALFRESVKRLLNAEQDFEVVADCATTREALEAISSTQVDLVLLDFDLGQQTGTHFFAEAERCGSTSNISGRSSILRLTKKKKPPPAQPAI